MWSKIEHFMKDSYQNVLWEWYGIFRI
jgi:hypothetical protein